MNHDILLIDDDARLGELLTEYFQQFNFRLTVAHTPGTGLKRLQAASYDIVILDVMLPEMDGFETLKRIRSNHTTPVIMLTARGETTDRIVGLELGADDYLPKPFEPRELVARINSVVKRSAQGGDRNPAPKYRDIDIDFDKGTVVLEGAELNLSSAEFEVLSSLAKFPSKIYSRDDLFKELRGHDWDAFNRSIDVTISRLRSKLRDDPKKPRFIRTVFGRGYQFIAEPAE